MELVASHAAVRHKVAGRQRGRVLQAQRERRLIERRHGLQHGAVRLVDEARPQRVVAPAHRLQRRPKRRLIKVPSQLQRARHVGVRPVRVELHIAHMQPQTSAHRPATCQCSRHKQSGI